MCIVKTNIGNEKRNAFNIFTVNVFPERSDSELLQTIIQNRTQNSCKQVHVLPFFCRVLGLLPFRYFHSIACSLIKRINLPVKEILKCA